MSNLKYDIIGKFAQTKLGKKFQKTKLMRKRVNSMCNKNHSKGYKIKRDKNKKFVLYLDVFLALQHTSIW